MLSLVNISCVCVCFLIGLWGEGEQVNEDINVRVNVKETSRSRLPVGNCLFLEDSGTFLVSCPCPDKTADFTLLLSTPNKRHLTLTKRTLCRSDCGAVCNSPHDYT